MASTSGVRKPIIGIVSMGEMGTGVAKLLLANGYPVNTCLVGRSKHTHERIKKANVVAYDSDSDFVAEADIILSIVPPRDAVATARRVVEASRRPDSIRRRLHRQPLAGDGRLVYIDLNAISPRTTRTIASLFVDFERPAQRPKPPTSPTTLLTRALSFGSDEYANQKQQSTTPEPLSISFLDGGIIGPPPSPPKTDVQPSSSSSTPNWMLPSLVISGPNAAALLPESLRQTLNMSILGDQIGTASTLKSCFASLTKGLTALATLSFTTAHTANVLPALQSHLEKYTPKHLQIAQGGLTSMPPKAYRWVEEMRQIGETFATEGGLEAGDKIFDGIAEVYKVVAEDTVLGEERTEHRKRGRSAEDVAECMREGIRKKKRDEKRVNSGDGRGDLVWKGSWS